MAVIGCKHFSKAFLEICRISRRPTHFKKIFSRTYLSESYACDHLWLKRLEEPVLKDINMTSYYVDLSQKYLSTSKISAIDLDLFAHKITESEQLEELEELVHKLRRTPETIKLLPSTTHAVIKSFLQFGQFESLIKILNDRLNYGIFPDFYCFNLMMDALLKLKNNRDATRVASLMMLQEDFDHPISKHMALYSCLSYVRDPQPDSWVLPPPPPPEKEPDDIVIIRINYLKPTYFDDHFDIKEPNKLVGKTLAMLGSHFDDEIGRTCKIIGLAFYDKLENLKVYISKALKKYDSNIVYKEGIEVLNNILNNASDNNDEPRKALLADLKSLVQELSLKVIDKDIVNDAEARLVDAIAKYEHDDVDQQQKLMEDWSKSRVKLVEDQVQDYIRKIRIKKLEEVKAEVKKREQLLYFFENYETNMIKADKYDKVAADVAAEKAKKKDSDDDYIPPEINTYSKTNATK